VSVTAERLIRLLPAVYGLRDGDDGPLRDLLGVVADQLAVLEDNLDALYDDQFVETCAPWVLPYIGDLLGITGLPPSPLTPRAEVAHTIAYRRRKGTAALLEQLARDVTGLPARAVECFELLAATQHLNHLRPECRAFTGIGDALRIESLGGPFERLPARVTLTHAVEVRRIASGRGRYDIPNVAIFLWRLRALRLTRSLATPDTAGDLRRFRFSPLGSDAPLFSFPLTEDDLTHLAEPANVPDRISRRAAAADLAALYGDDRSFLIDGVELDDLVVCDLSAWSAPADKVAVDPVLGRMLFPADTAPPLITFHYGLAGNIGGGEYERPRAAEAPGTVVVEVASGAGAVQAAIDALPPAGGVVEIPDSGRYEEPGLAIDATGRRVTLRAAGGARPVLALGGDLAITGDDAGAVVLDGLLLAGGTVKAGALGSLELRHLTLVPGAAPSLVVSEPLTEVTIERSIVGAIRADRDATVRIADGIVDATDVDEVAFSAPGGGPGATLTLEQVTVIGRIEAELLELVSNSLLLGRAAARRRQEGCVRFSHVPVGSLTPRRHHCVPERESDAARVAPVLTSRRYGDPGYCQLADRSAAAVRQGADDESELGAFHHLQLARREAHLRARVDEHLRFGLEAGVFHAT
jgi:hypothetical protein